VRLHACGLCLAALTAACTPVQPVPSDLPPGAVSFEVHFDATTFEGWEADAAAGCLARRAVADGFTFQTNPPRVSATTKQTAAAEQNRDVHRCFLTLPSATVTVRTRGQAR
jgi:hypothetical protein